MPGISRFEGKIEDREREKGEKRNAKMLKIREYATSGEDTRLG